MSKPNCKELPNWEVVILSHPPILNYQDLNKTLKLDVNTLYLLKYIFLAMKIRAQQAQHQI